MNILFFILKIIALSIVVFITYSLLRKYVFSKFKVNKWVIIGIAVVVLVVSVILNQITGLQTNMIFVTIQSGIFVVLFLWFMDTMGWGPKPAPVKSTSKNSKTKYSTTPVIKAKAKPNRLKNTDMEVINIKDIKKKKKSEMMVNNHHFLFLFLSVI